MPEINGQQTGKDPVTGRFIEGNKLGGRTLGSLDFKTKWIAFIEKIAAQNNITTEEVDEKLLAVAYKQMQSGDYRYWKDIQDRVYGTATQKSDIMSGGLPIPLLNVLHNNSNTKDSSSNQAA